MKVLLFLLILSFSQIANSKGFESLHVGIASSGPGGSALGHSYLLFCKKSYHLHLKRCVVVEYNLDINLGEKLEETKRLGFLDKINAFNQANFKVYLHSDQREFENKYFSRNQNLSYYKYINSSKKINFLFEEIKADQVRRLNRDYKDYKIFSNNCATKILDLFKISERRRFKPFKNHGLFDLDQYLFNFPIWLEDTISKSDFFSGPIVFRAKEQR